MKALVFSAALATLAALPAAALQSGQAANVAPVDLGVDLLTLKIHNQAVNCPNSCITAAVKVGGTDKGVKLELTDPNAALAPLAPVAGLVAPAEEAPAAERPGRARRKAARRVERPVEQAEVIEAGGARTWENLRK